jgi:2-amino-4-hydroxy-6-hydroxymethyldihydropteridine diphosphokinase
VTRAYIGLGTNLGDRLANINKAVALLARNIRIIEASALYETEPEDYKNQPDFYNCVVLADVEADATALLAILKNMEKQVGRTGSFQGGPRMIDADLLFYGREVINRPGLVVPHPRIPQRRFVLVPLAEIAADFVHPVLHKSIAQLLSGAVSQSRVVKVSGIGFNLGEGQYVSYRC